MDRQTLVGLEAGREIAHVWVWWCGVVGIAVGDVQIGYQTLKFGMAHSIKDIDS
jgi:hypothetical protein